MRFALATIALMPRGESDSPSRAARRQVFERAAEIGFEGIELSRRWLDYRDMSAAEIAELRRDAQAAGMCLSGVNLNRCIFTRTELAKQNVSDAERSIDVAADLGAAVVTLSLSMPSLPTRDRPPMDGSTATADELSLTADRLAALADCGLRRGVALSLELHDDGLLDSADRVAAMIERVARKNVGATPDLGNIVRGTTQSSDWLAAIEALAPLANNWHVKNYRRGQPAAIWDGDIDYRVALGIMREAGYRGWTSIEGYAAASTTAPAVDTALDHQRASLTYLTSMAARHGANA